MTDENIRVDLAEIKTRLAALEKLAQNLHERVGGRGFRDEGLEGRVGDLEVQLELSARTSRVEKLETDINNIGNDMRSTRALITGNGGGKAISAEFTEIKTDIKDLQDYNTENPSLTWMLKHKTAITIAVGVGVWLVIDTAKDFGLLPLLANIFGFDLP